MGTASTTSKTFYVSAARNTPELGREEEAELARRWQVGGDRGAANTLARANQRHVLALAMKYRHYGVPVDELVAEGNVGVVHALAKFQPGRGVRFGTYASYWVRAQMLSHVVRSYSSVGGSDGPMRSQIFFKLRRERVRVTTQFGAGEAADRELAERLGVSLERVRRMVQRLDDRDVSLEVKAGPDSDRLLDRMPAPDDQEQDLCSRQFHGCMEGVLARAVARLDARERFIVERRLMADSSEELSLAEIARVWGISRERARQIEERAKNKLRRFIAEDQNPAVQEWVQCELPSAAPSPAPVVRRGAPDVNHRRTLVARSPEADGGNSRRRRKLGKPPCAPRDQLNFESANV